MVCILVEGSMLHPTPHTWLRQRCDMVDYKFEWDFEQTREENYRRWRQLNNAERDAFNLAQELEAGARQIFNTMELRWRSEADRRKNEHSLLKSRSNFQQTMNMV